MHREYVTVRELVTDAGRHRARRGVPRHSVVIIQLGEARLT